MVSELGCDSLGKKPCCSMRMVLELRNDYLAWKIEGSTCTVSKWNPSSRGSHQCYGVSATSVFMQDGTCGLGTQKSAVLKPGGQRGTLKGVLWWFVMALLVGGKLAAPSQ